MPRLLPPNLTLEAVRGVRILTPSARVMRVPGVRTVLRAVERRLADTRASFFGGFYVAVLRKGARRLSRLRGSRSLGRAGRHAA